MNAHIVKSACLAAIAASLATSSPAWAEDVKGSKDHPALTRFEGAEIRAYEHKDFDEAVMPDRPIPREAEAKGLELEGKLTRISYRIDGKKSALEVYRNYQGALQAGGFKTLFECKGDEQCGGDFQSFVINGGKVRQPGQGDATFGGKYYVVLAREEAPTGDIYVFLDVMEDGSNHITPVFQQVLETKPMQTGRSRCWTWPPCRSRWPNRAASRSMACTSIPTRPWSSLNRRRRWTRWASCSTPIRT